MDFGIAGKVALVTAASKGLGRGSAEALAAEGCRVAICARTQAEVERTAEEIARKSGAEVAPFVCDLSQAAQIQQLLEQIRQRWGDPQIVVTNAGGPPGGNFATTKLDQFPAAIELTMMSAIRLTYATIDAMRAKNWGRIVMITSVSVKQPVPYILLSNTARAGLTGFMKTVAREVAASGVTLNAVLPGTHATDRVLGMARQRQKQSGESLEEILKAQQQQVPMGRMGEAADFGAVVAFLCSQQANFITGESVLVDGGAYAGLL